LISKTYPVQSKPQEAGITPEFNSTCFCGMGMIGVLLAVVATVVVAICGIGFNDAVTVLNRGIRSGA
jgi:hypothetical protein